MSENLNSPQNHPPTYETGLELAYDANAAFDEAKQADEQFRAVRGAAETIYNTTPDANAQWMGNYTNIPGVGEKLIEKGEQRSETKQKFEMLSDAAGLLLSNQVELDQRAQEPGHEEAARKQAHQQSTVRY